MYGIYLTGSAREVFVARMNEIATRFGIPADATWYISGGTVMVFDSDRSQYVAVGTA